METTVSNIAIVLYGGKAKNRRKSVRIAGWRFKRFAEQNELGTLAGRGRLTNKSVPDTGVRIALFFPNTTLQHVFQNELQWGFNIRRTIKTEGINCGNYAIEKGTSVESIVDFQWSELKRTFKLHYVKDYIEPTTQEAWQTYVIETTGDMELTRTSELFVDDNYDVEECYKFLIRSPVYEDCGVTGECFRAFVIPLVEELFLPKVQGHE